MSGKRYTDEFKIEAVRQVADRGYPDKEVTERLESGCVYDYRKVYDDLRDLGERCGKHRVHRLMRLAGIQAQRNQKQVPIGIHRIQDIAAVVVWSSYRRIR